MWFQIYDPLGNQWLSAFVALLPILLFFVSLVYLNLQGYVAGFLTVVLATLIALFVYDMPLTNAIGSLIYGGLYGLYPIAWIIIAAIFLYKLTVKSGYFDILRESIIAITPDQRIQVILIGFCFGAFLEGAIIQSPAAYKGRSPKPTNSAAVAFGAVGIPIIAMAGALNFPALEISSMAGHMLPPLSVFIPFFLVFLMDGLKGVKETWPVALVAGGSFALIQYLTATKLGPELPDIASAVVSIIVVALFLRIWKPKNVFKFDEEVGGKANVENKPNYSVGQIILAWLPFVILILAIIVWTQPWFKALFAKDGALNFLVFRFEISGLIGIMQNIPVVPEPKAVNSIFTFPLINTVGTSIFLVAIITMIILRVKVSTAIKTFGETLNEMKFAILTIALVVGFAFISNYSGISASLALALAQTGDAFAFFSPVVGWIGVFLTGSDTSSNLLFGGLQQLTARALDIPEVLFLAANSVGGVVGKMISPQSIAIACAAVGLVGRESDLFKFTVKYSIIFVIVIGLFTYALAMLHKNGVIDLLAITTS